MSGHYLDKLANWPEYPWGSCLLVTMLQWLVAMEIFEYPERRICESRMCGDCPFHGGKYP